MSTGETDNRPTSVPRRPWVEEVWRRLPAGARKDLGRLLQRIDSELERRSLPEPGPAGGRAVDRWWWQRVRER